MDGPGSVRFPKPLDASHWALKYLYTKLSEFPDHFVLFDVILYTVYAEISQFPNHFALFALTLSPYRDT